MALKNVERARRAVDAMKPLGFSRKLTVEVLKNLVGVYSSNWDLIEEDNYRVLADGILDAMEKDNGEEIGIMKEIPNQENHENWTSPVNNSISDNKFGSDEPGPSNSKRIRPDLETESEIETEIESGLVVRKRLRKNSAIEQREIVPVTGTVQRENVFVTGTEQRENVPVTGTEQRENVSVTGTEQRENVPVTGTEQRENVFVTGTEQRENVPVTGTEQRESVPPFPNERSSQVGTSQTGTRTVIDPITGEITTYVKVLRRKKKSNFILPLKEPKIEPDLETEKLNQKEENRVPGGKICSEIVLGSSSNGEIKLGFQFPVFKNSGKVSIDEIFSLVENRYLESFNDYRILNPGFSVRGFVNEMCELMADEMKDLNPKS